MNKATKAAHAYQRDGFYFSADPVLPEGPVHQAAVGAEQVKLGNYDTGVPPQNEFVFAADTLMKINNAHLANRALYDLLVHPALGAWVAAVSGATAVQVWATQLLVKPPVPTQAANVGWHQDRQYWKYWRDTAGLLTAWIALRPVSFGMGPLAFIRGSHRWGELEGGDFFSGDRKGQKTRIQVPDGEDWEEVEAPLPAGGVSLHDCLTLHGSGPNTGHRPRLSLAVHLRTEVARPLEGAEDYWVAHLDQAAVCPVIFGQAAELGL
jgi:ectoine hydroxylase-related dioxygenase (phytanoyl-CoA dioxygenase family)